MARPVQRRRGESGFALLIVFVMAAAIAIGLYMELPRSVFESQRAKEELLFDRGDQYKMGIKRYYTKFQRYPNTIDELEQTNGVRYLRRKYKDPFTGKDDWKILKFGPDGQITDSVHNKKNKDKQKETNGVTGSVIAGPSLGDLNQGDNNGARTGPNGAETNPALNRRPSDTGIGAQLAMGQQGGVVPGPGGVNNGQNPNGQYPPPPNLGGVAGGAVNPNVPNANGVYPTSQYQNGQYVNPQNQLPGAPVNPYAAGSNPNFTGNTGVNGLPGQYPQPQYGQNGQLNRLPGSAPSPYPGLPGQAANSQAGGQIGVPFGGGPNNGQNPALQMINQLLTAPRQGLQPGQLSTGGLNGSMPTGIAGVVSKHKGQGIKVLEERTKIHEWEFIYDVKKDKSLQKGMGGQQSGSLPGSGLNNSSGMGPNSNSQQNRRQ